MISKQISKNSIPLLWLCCILLTFPVTGCSGGKFPLAPVTGTVTVDGVPVPELTVAFCPISSEENPTPGPFSTGTTDKDGKFTLVSRDGGPGAVVGPHRVTLSLPTDATSAKLRDAEEHLADLRSEGTADAASIKAAKDNIAQAKQRIKEYDFVPTRYLKGPVATLDVPAEGLENHLIEMTKDPK